MDVTILLGLHMFIQQATIFVFWQLWHLYQLLQKTFSCMKWLMLKTILLHMWQYRSWLRDSFWTRGGCGCNYCHSARWHILSTQLDAGRGISAETNGLDDASSWRHWSVYSIYYHIRTMHYSCILNNRNTLFLRDIYITRVGVAMTVCWMIWYCYYFLPGLTCIFQLYSSGFSLSYYGYRYYVILCIGQLHPITMYMTGFGVCFVLVLSVIMWSFYYLLNRVLFHHDSWDCYWNVMAILCNLKNTFRLSVTKYLWFCKCAPPGCFCPWAFLLNIGLNMLPSDSFISRLGCLLGYSTGQFQALQLIVLAVFGALD